MAFSDLREFITALDKSGDLVRVKKEVDWDMEVGAISRRNFEQSGPAILFEKIKDYSPGYAILNGPVATWRRVAIALGLPPDTSVRQLYAAYEERREKKIKPVVVQSAPCQENVMIGSEVDVYKLPAPMVHDGDGGRYIGTWDIIITKDPETGWTNWGMYRFMTHTQNMLTGWPQATSQLAMMMKEKYLPRKQPMPVAIVIGCESLCHMVATDPYRPGENEADYAGGLRGASVELIQCKTQDLMVPAHAEIVIEGEVLPDRIALDGPFGEYPGYYGAGALKPRQSPVIKFDSMTCKKNPIYQTLITGPTIGYESTHFSGLSKEAMLYTITSRMCPQVCSVNVLVSRNIAVVQVNGDITNDMAKRLMVEVFSNLIYIKYVVLIDSDVNPADPVDVLWALSTRVDPGVHMHVFPDMTMEPLDPSTKGSCDKVGFDARKPVGERSEGFVRARIPGYEKTRLEDYLVRT